MIIKIIGPDAEKVRNNLINWSLSDESGETADRASITFNTDGDNWLPPSGSEYEIHINGEFRGIYQVSAITEILFPASATIQLSPAKFNVSDKTGWREQKKNTFAPATILDVVKAVMEPHGYEVRVDPNLAPLPTEHLNQNEETDKAFISRLASKYDAIAKPVNHMFIFGKKGNINKLSGSAKSPVAFTRSNIKSGSPKIEHPSEVRTKGIKANWRTVESGESGDVVIGSAPFHRLREPFKTEIEAKERAQAKLKELSRAGQKFTAEVINVKGCFAEATATIEGFTNPRALGIWSLDSVSMRGTRTTYTTTITASRPTE